MGVPYIAACLDEIDHTALMRRVRRRISNKRFLRLIRTFLKAGILPTDGVYRGTYTDTP